MIEVFYDERTMSLLVDGHADHDNRVCAAVSAGCATLVAGYGADILSEGRFRWNPSEYDQDGRNAVTFFVKMAKVLAYKYPNDIKVTTT